MFIDQRVRTDVSSFPATPLPRGYGPSCLSLRGCALSLFDSESPVERARLIDQDRILTRAMGGPLRGLPDLPSEAIVLDLACGPGGWVLDVAFERPDIEVAGVDSSASMIAYANARARSQRRRNASFGVMDITQPLDFADDTFDLINARFLGGVLKRSCWLPLCTACLSLLKPGGWLRLTEADTLGMTSSPAFECLDEARVQLMSRLGYGLGAQGSTLLTPFLADLLQEAGYSDIQTSIHGLDFSSGTEAWTDQFWNVQLIVRQVRPLPGIPHAAFDRLFTQMLIEMQQQDFRATWPLVSVVGRKPGTVPM